MSVTVRDRIVSLTGMAFDEREREALRVLAENVPGVKGRRGSPRGDRARLGCGCWG